MEILEIRQELIKQLEKLNGRKGPLSPTNFQNADFTRLKNQLQLILVKLKSNLRVYVIIACVLLAITGTISFLKILQLGNTPDLNKGALLILLTVINSIVAIVQRIKVERLEKQFLLVDILQKLDTENFTAR